MSGGGETCRLEKGPHHSLVFNYLGGAQKNAIAVASSDQENILASNISVLTAGVAPPRRVESGQIRHPAGSGVITDISNAIAIAKAASYNEELAHLDATTMTGYNSCEIFRLREQTEHSLIT